MIQITCPSCSLTLLLPDHLHGQEVTCSGCKAPVDTTNAEKMVPRPVRDDPPREAEPDSRRDDDRRDDRAAPREPGQQKKPSAPATVICLTLAGIFSILSGVTFLVVIFYQGAHSGMMGPRNGFLPALVFSTILILITNVVPAIFQFIGAAFLARVEAYGMVMAAAILSLAFGAVQTLFCGLSHLAVLASGPPWLQTDDLPLGFLTAVLLLASGIFNLVAGGLTLGTLANGAVARVYQQRFDDEEERHTRRRRRGRDRDRDGDGDGGGDLRWGRRHWSN